MMAVIQETLDYLSGKKTYILAAIYVAYGIVQKDPNTIMQGLMIITGRGAIAKVEAALLQAAFPASPKSPPLPPLSPGPSTAVAATADPGETTTGMAAV